MAARFSCVGSLAVVDRDELRARCVGERAKALAVALAGLDLRHHRRIVLGGEPARDALLLDRDSEGLVEYAVVLHVGDLMGELVEDQPRDLGIGVAYERGQDRVVEVAQRREGGDAADVDVVARRGELCGFGLRRVSRRNSPGSSRTPRSESTIVCGSSESSGVATTFQSTKRLPTSA